MAALSFWVDAGMLDAKFEEPDDAERPRVPRLWALAVGCDDRRLKGATGWLVEDVYPHQCLWTLPLSPERTPRAFSSWRVVTPWEGGVHSIGCRPDASVCSNRGRPNGERQGTTAVSANVADALAHFSRRTDDSTASPNAYGRIVSVRSGRGDVRPADEVESTAAPVCYHCGNSPSRSIRSSTV